MAVVKTGLGLRNPLEREQQSRAVATGLGLQNPLARREQLSPGRPVSIADKAQLLFGPVGGTPGRPPHVESQLQRPAATFTSTARGNFGHVVVIPTQNRPLFLNRCVESIVENMRRFGYSRKIKIVVVDDSTEPRFEKANARVLERFGKKYPHLAEVVHYDKAKQAQFISRLGAKSGVSLDPFLFPDKSRLKHGFGGVRNLSLLVAMRHAAPTDLVTFFDDDIALENLHLTKTNGVTVPTRSHLFNFFSQLDSVFSNSRVKLVSGRVTKDIKEPQRLIPFFLEKVGLFVKTARGKKPTELVGGLASQLTEVPEVGRHLRYNQAFRLLSAYSQGINRRGAFNLGVRYYDPNAPVLTEIEKTSSLGGANVTLRADILARSVPYPTANLRGEDSTWSMLMHRLLDGGVYRINLPVLHHKASSRGIFREYGQSISFLPVYDVLKQIVRSDSPAHLARQIKINATPEAIRVGHAKIRRLVSSEFAKWDSQVKSSSQMLADKRSWWHGDPKLRKATLQLTRNLALFGSSKRNEVYDAVIPPEKMHQSLHEYAGLIETWPQVLAAVKNV
ncbi:MAG: glycosyltransferase [Candidatus Micrarchaeota archaeon]